MHQLRNEIVEEAKKNPGPKISMIGFIIGLFAILILIFISEFIGRLLFYFSFITVVIGIILTITSQIDKNK